MPCPDVSMLRALVEHALEPGDAQAIRDHLSGCASCRGRFTRSARTSSLAGAEFLSEPDATGGASGSEAMLPVQVPGYEVLELIGEGGMGTVYRAKQLSLGRLVALKLLPRQRPSESLALERFRREALTASSLNHPNICTIYDRGDVEGRPYLAMELIDGRTLALRRLEGISHSESLHLMRQVVGALAAAHQAGIVHRDVKPGNIMVRADDVVKLVDFGLARSEQRGVGNDDDSHTTPGMVVGTLRYMSPEQLHGLALTTATDVFSLGVVWYELLTGRHPFPADSLGASMQAIQFGEAVPPSTFTAEINGDIDMLIMSMLAKSPASRPTLDAVQKALDGWHTSRPVPLAAPARVLVGRRDDMAALWSALGAALQGRGSVVTLLAEAGMGKTSLVEGFLAELAQHEVNVLTAQGRCVESLEGTEAYLPVLEALEGLLRGPSGAHVVQQMRRVAPSWYAQCAPMVGDLRHAFPGASQERRKAELCALFDSLTPKGAAVFVIDDMHWSDTSTMDLMSYLAARAGSMRLLVILTARPSDLHYLKHPFRSAHQQMLARGTCREVTLGPLTPEHIEQLLSARFPNHMFPASLSHMIHERGGGNPFFTSELIRLLRDQGMLREDDDGWRFASSLSNEVPSSLRSLISRQLERLSELDHSLLRAASVQGQQFEAAIVARALGLDPLDVEERLAEVARVHSLVRLREEVELPDGTLTLRFQFVHALFHDAFFASLLPARRAQLSAAVANALIAFWGESAAQVTTTLALLFEAARDAQRSQQFFLAAAGNAVQVGAYREMTLLARRGLAQVARLPEGRERALFELGHLLNLDIALRASLGFTCEELASVHARAAALCKDFGGEQQLPFMFSIALFYLLKGDVAASVLRARELIEVAAASGTELAAIFADAVLAVTAIHDGRGHDAVAAYGRVAVCEDTELRERFHTSSGSRIEENGLHHAWCLWLAGYAQASIDMRERTLSIVAATPGLGAVNAQVFAAITLQISGARPAVVLAQAERGLKAAHGMELPFYAALVEAWIGWARALQGELQAGMETITRALAAKRALGSALFDPHIMLLITEVHMYAARPADALASVRAAVELLEATGDRYFESEVYRWLGVVEAANGADPERIDACFARALAVSAAQRAPLLALRAAASWAVLRGDDASVRGGVEPLVKQLYASLVEGRDSPDALGAAALISAWTARHDIGS